MTNSRTVGALGRIEPRLLTPPRRELTPATSVGYDQIEYARDVLGRPLDPWQEFAVIHAGELREDGRLRFRIVILLVSRQQGKTELLSILPPYWLDVDEVPMILGMSTKLDYAQETWTKSKQLIARAPELEPLRVGTWFKTGNGKEELRLTHDAGEATERLSRYKIAASTEEGGRSLTIHRLLIDEFRHTDIKVWDAAEPATSAVDDPQIWCTSNAGSDKSVLLNQMRDDAVRFIETGQGADDILLMEWSAPQDADPTDLEALAQANPNLGRRGRRPETLLEMARAAVAAGGEQLTFFKTNYMCIRVTVTNPAVDPGSWRRCLDPGTLDDVRDRLAVCLDVSPDGLHATLVAAGVLADGRVRVEPVKAWEGSTCTNVARRELPALIAKVKPKVFAWFPTGPAASLAADLADRRKTGRREWPPPGVTVEEVRGELTAAAMGFEEQVRTGRLAHSGDPLLDAHVAGAERLKRGDAWVFQRTGVGHVDAVYAAAGAVHAARTMPPPPEYRRLSVVEHA